MADTVTPNFGIPLPDLTNSLEESRLEFRAAFTLIDGQLQQIVNQQQSLDASTLGGQDLAHVLSLANATGVLPVAKVDGFDTAWDARLALALDTAPATLDTLLEIVAEVQDNESAIGTITAQLGTLQTGLTAAEGDITALQSGKLDVAAKADQPTAEAGLDDTNFMTALAVAQAIAALAGGGGSPGQVVLVHGNTPLEGTVKINGATLSRGAYPELWAFAQTSGVLAATEGGKNFWEFGPGDGSTTFSMPEVRGEFPRFWDDGRGVDSGRAIGSFQSWAIENITGSITTNNSRNNIIGASGAFSRSGIGALAGANGGGSGSSSVAFNASSVVQTANETRSRSIALLACMYF